MIRKILKHITVIQEYYTTEGYIKRRLNPLNPISYIVVVMTIIVGLILFGVIGFWKEVDMRNNPFKYH